MPISNNINTYADVAETLQAALPHGKIDYRLSTVGEAVSFVQRAYKYRQLLQKQLALQSNVKGHQPATPYDRMKLYRVGQTITIDFHPAAKGEFILPDGTRETPVLSTPIATPVAEVAPLRISTQDADLLAGISDLIKNIGDAPDED